MKSLLTILAMICTVLARAEPAILPTNAPPVIELHDQYDVPQKISFPTTNIIFLTVADRKGCEQIAGWVAPLKQRFGSRVAIHGIADMSSVPRPLRNFVRKKFGQAQTYPVMLDWSGDTVKKFTPVTDEANVFLLDRQGGIVMRHAGVADEAGLKKLFAAIDAVLGETPVATKPKL